MCSETTIAGGPGGQLVARPPGCAALAAAGRAPKKWQMSGTALDSDGGPRPCRGGAGNGGTITKTREHKHEVADQNACSHADSPESQYVWLYWEPNQLRDVIP